MRRSCRRLRLSKLLHIHKCVPALCLDLQLNLLIAALVWTYLKQGCPYFYHTAPEAKGDRRLRDKPLRRPKAAIKETSDFREQKLSFPLKRRNSIE